MSSIEEKNSKKLSRNQRRRLKKKEEKKLLQKTQEKQPENDEENQLIEAEQEEEEIDYVSYPQDVREVISESDPNFEEFQRIFSMFTPAEELCLSRKEQEKKIALERMENTEEAPEGALQNIQETAEKQLSRKERKKAKALNVASLKQLVVRPDVVEAHDATAADPRLLVYLKSYRNTVPVPRHWCHKRKYLQGKRGIEKPPFCLPDFISSTGITEVRTAISEEEERKKSKQKAREKVQPKMGRVDIDYQVLHDAFFRYQTKPSLSNHGDLYYEGKEFEVKLKSKTPGTLSDELKKALGMSDGVPPPWLLNVQRYGPPPAYPFLKIPGLNAPIPEGASFGYHPGGWGKPPVDETGVPIYGNVFAKPEPLETSEGDIINKEHWGEIDEEEEEEEESEDEEEEEKIDETEDMQSAHAPDASGVETPMTDGMSSVVSGVTTPGIVDLRKGVRGEETPETPAQLFTVLQQKETAVGSSIYGSSHEYVVPGSKGADKSSKLKKEEPESSSKESKSGDDDRKRKRKSGKSSDQSKSKKYKDFKF